MNVLNYLKHYLVSRWAIITAIIAAVPKEQQPAQGGQPEQLGDSLEQPEPQEPWVGGVENVKNWTREEKGKFLNAAFSFLGTRPKMNVASARDKVTH